MRPVVGVTRGANAPLSYRRALQDVGAATEEIGPGSPRGASALDGVGEALRGLAGLVLSGGLDLDPALYGEREAHPTVEVDAERDRMELPLTRAALARGLPILGICRGIQTLNVALGGSLWQDLPSQRPGPVVHKEPEQRRDRKRLLHVVDVAPGSLLSRIVGPGALAVNSIHHQAVRRPAPGLAVVATAPDGVVEAVESPTAPFVLGVQWHPEELWEGEARQRALFAAFVEAAARRPGQGGDAAPPR